MGIELLAGIGAALSWGVFACFGTLAARRVGGWITNLGATIITTALILPMAIVAWPLRRADPGPEDVAVLAIGALGVLIADVGVYRLLTIAPVAIVYPIFASNSAVVAVLAVLLLGETLSPVQALGVACVATGIFLLAWRRPERSPAAGGGSVDAGSGTDPSADAPAPPDAPTPATAPAPPRVAPVAVVLAAIGLTLLAGVVMFLVAGRIKALGWFPALALERSLQTALLLGAIAAGFPPLRRLRRLGREAWLLLAAMAVCNAIATVFYGLGNELGSTAITATVTSTFAAVPVALGIIVFHERPQRHQRVGIVGALVGIVLLGAG
ncbi:MAG: EamA family transporter [Chloroflexota bacterium]